MRFDIAALEFESFKEFLLDNFVSSFSKSLKLLIYSMILKVYIKDKMK